MRGTREDPEAETGSLDKREDNSRELGRLACWVWGESRAECNVSRDRLEVVGAEVAPSVNLVVPAENDPILTSARRPAVDVPGTNGSVGWIIGNTDNFVE